VNIATPNYFRVPALAAALRALVLAVLAVVAVAVHAAPPEQRGKPAATWVKGHILVQPRAGLSDAEFDQALATQGGKAVGRLGNLDVYVVSIPPTASEQAVANALAHHPNVKFAEVDRLVPPALIPNDADYGSEWHLQTINAPVAWQLLKAYSSSDPRSEARSGNTAEYGRLDLGPRNAGLVQRYDSDSHWLFSEADESAS